MTGPHPRKRHARVEVVRVDQVNDDTARVVVRIAKRDLHALGVEREIASSQRLDAVLVSVHGDGDPERCATCGARHDLAVVFDGLLGAERISREVAAVLSAEARARLAEIRDEVRREVRAEIEREERAKRAAAARAEREWWAADASLPGAGTRASDDHVDAVALADRAISLAILGAPPEPPPTYTIESADDAARAFGAGSWGYRVASEYLRGRAVRDLPAGVLVTIQHAPAAAPPPSDLAPKDDDPEQEP